ncbi:DUF6982 domain-containing protein [Terriglobus roseus]|uniref:Uncharacterized protein n=1 Tax=Terriglobus roseus TaxID=392734 RepID=A0A1G7J2R7_9BACT|nr:hypothetical protein [Terriglobus roseus]SDF19163.1 hypothetical protein SAMN05444167_1669 [Terriglobus roseus]
MAGSQKKVVLRRFSPGLLWGYLPTSGFAHAGFLDLLDLSGRIQSIPLSDVKYAAFVRDFNTNDTSAPERLLRKTFLARPRTEGLWLRLTLRDGDRMEGMASLDLTLADGWVEDMGVQLVPPDIRGNTQRLYVPRAAIDQMEVLAVVTSPSKRKTSTPMPSEETQQPDLFSMPLPPDSRTH